MEKFKIYNRRYLGSKYKLLEFIEKIVEENTENSKVFLDLFAGTGVVADYFNKKYDVVLNDLLRCNYFSYECFFSNLEYDEKKLIEIMKKYNKKIVEDNNYYSENFKDTYLSEKNLKKVGFIRDDIDDLFEKKAINKREKAILITALIYSVDKIANTVGHYDAYRKNGDLEKELILKFPQIENENNKNNKIFCMDANELVKKFSADIVYIDPPYNSRQYSDAYHFLENIATNNKPEVFGIAKKMDRTHIKSKYCLSSAKQTLEELIKNIEAKYKSAESVDKFFDDPNNVEMLKQMDKYNDELRNAIISTTQLENMYSKIGKPTSDKAQLEKVNEERLSFLANMAEFSQKLQKQQSIGDINEIKKLSSTGKADYKKLSYKDMENITFDKLYSMIKNGDQKSIPENLAILDSLMKQNNSLFNYTLTTLIGFKNTNNYQEIRDMQIKQNEVQKYAETFIGFKQSALSFFLPTDKELENLKKADPKNGTPKNELIKHNSGIALNTIILGK